MANTTKNKKATDLIYDSRFNFKKDRNNKKFGGLSFTSKFDIWKNFMINWKNLKI